MGGDGILLSEDTKYSVVPIFVVCHLFDPYLRFSWDFVVLVGIVPGPGHKNLEVFIRPFLEEIQLSQDGQFKVWDIVTGEWHLLRMYLLFMLADLRGIACFTDGNQHPAKVACHECDMVGIHSRSLHTTIYPLLGRQLDVGHPLRAVVAEHPIPHDDQSKDESDRYSTAVDAPRFEARTHESIMKAGRKAEESKYVLTSPKHPRRKHFMHKKPWAGILKETDVPKTVKADSSHTQDNFGKIFAKTSIGYGPAEMTLKVANMEMKRGRFSRAELLGRPWVMKESTEFNNIIASLNIPRSCGGRLKAPLVLLNISHYKMANWKRLIGHIGIYGLLKAKAFRDAPKYLDLWVDSFKWWEEIHLTTLTEADLARLSQAAYAIYTRMESLMPTKILRICLHYFTHVPTNVLDCGPLLCCNMCRDERAGATVTKASCATRGFEVGIARCYMLRDLCSFLRMHDPSLFEFARPLKEGPLMGMHQFKRGKSYNLTESEQDSLMQLYNQTRTTDRHEMAEVLINAGSDMTVDQLHMSQNCVTFQAMQSAWRRFKTFGLDSDVSKGICTVKWKEQGRQAWGVLVQIIKHRRYEHPLSEINVLLQVSEWSVQDGSSVLKTITRKRQPFVCKWVRLQDVSEEVVFSVSFFFVSLNSPYN